MLDIDDPKAYALSTYDHWVEVCRRHGYLIEQRKSSVSDHGYYWNVHKAIEIDGRRYQANAGQVLKRPRCVSLGLWESQTSGYIGAVACYKERFPDLIVEFEERLQALRLRGSLTRFSKLNSALKKLEGEFGVAVVPQEQFNSRVITV